MLTITSLLNAPLGRPGIQVNGPNMFALPASDSINHVSLAAGVAKTFTVPADARILLFASAKSDGTAQRFYARYYGGAAVVPVGDVTNGAGSEDTPVLRDVTGLATISLISAAACIVTITSYSYPASTGY